MRYEPDNSAVQNISGENSQHATSGCTVDPWEALHVLQGCKNHKRTLLFKCNIPQPMSEGRQANKLVPPTHSCPQSVDDSIFRLPVLTIPHICHLDHLYIGGEKSVMWRKFQISIHDRCGEMSNFSTSVMH